MCSSSTVKASNHHTSPSSLLHLSKPTPFFGAPYSALPRICRCGVPCRNGTLARPKRSQPSRRFSSGRVEAQRCRASFQMGSRCRPRTDRDPIGRSTSRPPWIRDEEGGVFFWFLFMNRRTGFPNWGVSRVGREC